MTSELTVKIARVGHLNGTQIGYYLPKPIVGSKDTLVLIPTFGSSAKMFAPQTMDEELLSLVNVLVLEPIGQGSSKTHAKAFTLWDSAYALLQAMDTLSVRKAFVLGESNGGSIAARMALYAPERISGVIPSVTSLGNQQTQVMLDETFLKNMATVFPPAALLVGSDTVPPITDNSIFAALGPNITAEQKELFIKSAADDFNSYHAPNGKEKVKQAILAVLTRDSLLPRLSEIACPVLWIAGENDPYVKVEEVKKEAALIKTVVQFEVIAGAYHLPTWTHAAQLRTLLVGFIKKYSGVNDARALREAVGMVDI